MTGPLQAPLRRQRRLSIANRQRDCCIDGIRLRRVLRHHLEHALGRAGYDLTVHLVSATRMAEINERHLNHTGPTDVITFDYGESGTDGLWGEVLVCPAVAVEQARVYGTSWQEEVLRYIVHGLLHLCGYDDRRPADRRIMKREEDRHLAALLANHPARTIQPRSTTRVQP
jgi:probable rRNA maturation factor